MLDFLQKLADSDVFSSKEHNARFNDLLQDAFANRSVGRYSVPKIKSYKIKYWVGDTVIEQDFPFVLCAYAAIEDV